MRAAHADSQQDHGGVAVTVAVALGHRHERFNFVGRQVLAGSQLGVRPA
jgi:hypothetical protein